LADRLLLWRGLDEWRAEAALVALTPTGLSARGTQLGLGYRLDYALNAPEDFVTQSVEVTAVGEGWWRRLVLEHDGHGAWRSNSEEAPGVEGALDCDLGFSPLTNLMPIRRHDLHRRAAAVEIVAAWVSVPDLTLHASRQRYEHVRASVVRYTDLGTHAGFTSELVVDEDGFVVVYPELAERV
jgi:uncharacterized protein